MIFSLFVSMGPYGRKKIQSLMTFPLKVHITLTPQKTCILLGKICSKVVQRIVKFAILDFCHFFFVFS